MSTALKRLPKRTEAATLALNATLMRTELIKKLLDPRVDINYECGYPDTISSSDYATMYKREGVAKRVVNVFPKESWAQCPKVYEQEKPAETEFEKALDVLIKKHLLWHFLQRVDELSGVGRFGVLLLGLDDGLDMSLPAAGINERGEPSGEASASLIYLRAFDESVVTVASSEQDKTNPRYGFPIKYNINYADEATGNTFMASVHWTRIFHVADNRGVSEVFGTPRMESVYNRLLDIRKILSGSGEMFWKGAFPGYSFEVNPDQKDATIDATTMRAEFESYANGLQRYLALTGVTAKSLSPQVADPAGHIKTHLEHIAITLGIPMRIFLGSERGELSSNQDSKAWNARIMGRQNTYLNPMIICPLITRFVHLGILPPTKEMTEWGEPKFTVEWPDLNTVTNTEKADIGLKRTQALAAYVGGNVQSVMTLEHFLARIMDMSEEEAAEVADAAEEQALDLEAEQEEEVAQAALETEATVVDESGAPVSSPRKTGLPLPPQRRALPAPARVVPARKAVPVPTRQGR